MTYTQPTEPPRKPWRKRHRVLAWTGFAGIVLVALITVGAVIGAQAGNGTKNVTQAAHSQPPSSAAPPPTTAAPPAVPDAKGTYQGSCDYTLSSSLYGNDHLIGEIDLKNTGNTGTVVRTRITWPQEGASPVTARKTVRLPFGASKPVRFSVPVASQGNVVTLLQSWQERHNGDGCTYHAAFTSTFGAVHG